MKKIVAFLSGCSVIIVLSACIDSAGPDGIIDPDSVYFDYKIWGEEGNDSVTVMLQFKEGGAYGPSIGIYEPGNVTLDGQRIPVDSSSMNGPFYQVTKHINAFTGKHTIVFTNVNKKKFKEEFYFKPFTLVTVLPDTLSRKKLRLEFSGLDKEDYVRILLTDTSFTSEGINRIDTVMDNHAVITREELASLENGPIQLEFAREHEKEIETDGWESGRISIVYSLKREFFLKD